MSWYRTEISINLNPDKEPFVFTLGQAFLTLLFFVALGSAYFFYNLYSTNQNKEDEAKKLVRAVGEIIILPEAGLPTIATVTDPKALEGQPFFENAEIGDKVLVYPDSKKAILYRPSIRKIVEVMPFTGPEDIEAKP